jgi:Fe-S oxidoreductase
MCPSFQGTLDDRHSTRGRANALRAFISGRLGPDGLTSEAMHEVMDLCLECKACKTECPSNVDMAKLKYEFLDNYYKANKMPLRTRLFASINRVNRIGSRLAPLSNWGARSPLGKLVSSTLLGVHPKRRLPAFAPLSFPRWFNARGSSDLSRTVKGTVVLFNDTFMNYNYPQIGMATVELLEAAGYRVELANTRCCGRPMISKGLLSEAAASARHNVDLLYSYAERGMPIIGCEPSCLLTFRDEYPEMLKDDKSKTVAQQSYLIDEFLAALQDQGELDLEFSDLSKKVLFHGHCHQKSLVGTASSLKALRLPPNYEVELINSGCCGMAGSFGFEKEHYEVSMKIGEQVLFPAINAKGPDWEVAVMGISCRQQVEHGTGRPARHLAEVLRDALV